MKVKVLILISALTIMFAQSGCTLLDTTVNSVSGAFGLNDKATVITKKAQIRTSYAVVAADLLEVKLGDQLDVIDQMDFEKVLWYRVRAHDEANTEGWIEAQNVITGKTLEKSVNLSEEFRNLSPQASGQLRAASNLRLASDMTPENVLFKLATGSTFEIMDWKFVEKVDAADVDDAKKGEQKQQVKKSKNEEIEAAKEEGEPEKLEEKYDIWYLVRLDKSVSPAPAGWLFGRQVELQVPSDIVFFQHNNRKFVTWQRFDTDSGNKVNAGEKVTAPGDWVILSRTNTVKAIEGVEPDFDGILVLAFDKYNQEYYTSWRTSGEVWGLLPLKMEGTGNSKSFTLQMRRPDGTGTEEKRFVITRDKNRVKITPPEDIAAFDVKPTNGK